MSNQHIQSNIEQFYSNLEPFRIAQKYTDLTIECDNVYFQCHRLTLASASQFFDSMLADTFRECKEKHLSFREFSATTLSKVLQFIYTGDVTVTCANICDLFRASKFFALPGIADICLEFVKSNRMSVNTTLKMYSLACQDKNGTLIDTLSQDIVAQFRVFSKAKIFLEIPFNDFKIILDKFVSSSTGKEEALLNAIYRWLIHCRKERFTHFDQLFKMVRFGRISTEVAGFLFSRLNKDQGEVELSVEATERDDFAAMPRATKPQTLPTKKLCLFVKYPEENSLNMIYVDEHENCTSSEFSWTNNSKWIRTIALDDYLYGFGYVRRNSAKVNNRQIFCALPLVDKIYSSLELNTPPIIFGDVSLCRGRNNNIYAYNQTLDQPLKKTDSRCSVLFTDEEMNRGVYIYNADLDVWLPVPAMPIKVGDACMTTHNGLLYLIGGTNSASSTAAKFVQTYDYREGMWQVLPKNTLHDRVGADCCVHDGKIYVCGGRNKPTVVERYDPIVGEWEELEKRMNFEMQYIRLISYNHKLWAIGGSTPGSESGNGLSIQSYPNEVTSTVDCKNCPFCPHYQAHDDPERLGIKRKRYLKHNITYTYANSWMKKDILQKLKYSTGGVIVDAVVF